jgi:hypothetical protein
LQFNDEQLRILENVHVSYDAWLNASRDLADLGPRLAWKRIKERDYLYQIRDGRGNGTSLGPRSDETEARHRAYVERRQDAEVRLGALKRKQQQYGLLYRALRLPTVSTMVGRLLRALDVQRLLGDAILVVGTNTLPAYELEAGARFADGLDATEDFDLAWRAEDKVVLHAAPSYGGALLHVLKSVDETFTVNSERPFQARNAEAYEVEILVAPSRVEHYPFPEMLRPVPLPEQEWLLLGRPVSQVLCDRSGVPCRIVAPDPRWMALHKSWLADKPQRNPRKVEKDRAQGQVLLDALRDALHHYPLDANFRAEVPEELRRYLPPESP